MRTLAILPVKSFGAAKQRLSGLLATGAREALAQAMASDVLASLGHVPELDSIVMVTTDRAAASVALSRGAQVLGDLPQAGQSHAAVVGINHALDSGFERVLLVPGDTPLLDPTELSALLRRAEHEGTEVVIVPDRHGTGTNVLLLAPPQAIEPSFGPGSLERHLEAAHSAGLRHAAEPLPSLALDVDTPEDLDELSAVLERRRGVAAMTSGALLQIDRTRARGSVSCASRAPDLPIQASA